MSLLGKLALARAELEARNHETNIKLGIKLPEDTMADLLKLARETGHRDKLPF